MLFRKRGNSFNSYIKNIERVILNSYNGPYQVFFLFAYLITQSIERKNRCFSFCCKRRDHTRPVLTAVLSKLGHIKSCQPLKDTKYHEKHLRNTKLNKHKRYLYPVWLTNNNYKPLILLRMSRYGMHSVAAGQEPPGYPWLIRVYRRHGWLMPGLWYEPKVNWMMKCLLFLLIFYNCLLEEILLETN